MDHYHGAIVKCLYLAHSRHNDVRGMEAEWSASAPCDWQWNNAGLFTFPFPHQRATTYCSTELSRIHCGRAWRQQR